MSGINVIDADLARPAHAAAVVELLDMYARDPMGGGRGLPEHVRRELVPRLREQNNALVLLACDEDAPLGLVIAFVGFSTFAARPLINVHDLAVRPEWRGRGVGRMLLDSVERKARELGCCKLTLEVREDNSAARRLYQSLGYGPPGAEMAFWTKPLL